MFNNAKKYVNIFNCFMIYNLFGWLYEVGLDLFYYGKGFVNHGFLFGPYLPVYGFGSLLIIGVLYPRTQSKDRKKLMNICVTFLLIILLTTTVELLTSYLMQYTIGEFLWDYSRYQLQFEGRISVIPSLRFGIGGLFILYVIQPILEKWKRKLENTTWYYFFSIMFFLIFIGDLLLRIPLGSNYS